MAPTLGDSGFRDPYGEIYGFLAEYRDQHLEELLDQALAATFPASDPVALTAPRESA